jgi:16S rRNA G966 N2-methylase RsmD
LELLHREIQEFINRQLHSTAADLMLKASKYPKWDMKAIAQQLVGKQIAQKKLPSWFKNENILYPIRLSMEQCSSEETALYKSTIISSGKGIDLTGGFGVDTYFLAQNTQSVIYCERNQYLAGIVSSNFNAFNQSNCEIHTGDGISYLQQLEQLDWIFLDPARRKESERVFRLEDCEPNVIALKSLFFEKADLILIKTAPLLDIQQTLVDLDCVKEVHVISVNNDCKEVLYLLEKGYSDDTQVFCINLKKGVKEEFSFTYTKERNTINQYSEPLAYLYEPNSSIMKSGAFKSIASKYGLYKLQQHSHLYTSEKLVTDFPGRSFRIKAILNPDKKSIAKHINGKANLACRNYPQKVIDLKKKLKLKDGGDDYLFATTLINDKHKLILCSKV